MLHRPVISVHSQAGNLAAGLAGIPSNLMQAAFGLAASTLLALVLKKSGYVRKQFPHL